MGRARSGAASTADAVKPTESGRSRRRAAMAVAGGCGGGREGLGKAAGRLRVGGAVGGSRSRQLEGRAPRTRRMVHVICFGPGLLGGPCRSCPSKASPALAVPLTRHGRIWTPATASVPASTSRGTLRDLLRDSVSVCGPRYRMRPLACRPIIFSYAVDAAGSRLAVTHDSGPFSYKLLL